MYDCEIPSWSQSAGAWNFPVKSLGCRKAALLSLPPSSTLVLLHKLAHAKLPRTGMVSLSKVYFPNVFLGTLQALISLLQTPAGDEMGQSGLWFCTVWTAPQLTPIPHSWTCPKDVHIFISLGFVGDFPACFSVLMSYRAPVLSAEEFGICKGKDKSPKWFWGFCAAHSLLAACC